MLGQGVAEGDHVLALDTCAHAVRPPRFPREALVQVGGSSNYTELADRPQVLQ